MGRIDESFSRNLSEVKFVSDAGSVVSFIIVSFAFAVVLLMKRETLPPRLKRPMALVGIVLIAFSFFLIVYSFLNN